MALLSAQWSCSTRGRMGALAMACTTALLLYRPCMSQEPDSVLERLLDMPLSELVDITVVTASKTARSPSDITQKIDVVTRQDIDRTVSGNRNVAELIQYLPGASVKALSRNDANWGAYGGIGPKYSTYMVQGLPVDAFIDPMSIEPMAVERIEVQRGPASVLYPNYLSQDFAGNQAPLAGTVNLILREVVPKPSAVVSLGYGLYNTFSGSGYHENRLGRLSVVSGVSFERSNYTNYGSANSWLNMDKDPVYNKGKGFVGINAYLDENEKHGIHLYGNQTLHMGDVGRIHRGYDHRYTLANAGYTGRLSRNLELAVKGGVRWYNRSWQEDSIAGARQLLKETDGVQQLIVPADFHLTLNHFNNSNLTVGADGQRASYVTWAEPVRQSRTTGNDATAVQVGGYIQEELQVDRFTIRAGGRINRIGYDITRLGSQAPGIRTQSWIVFLWSAGARYRITDAFSLFTNAGNSFMSPGLKSIGGTLRASDRSIPGRNGQLPNPSLDPEEGIGLDVGFDCALPSRAHLSARAFSATITDAIIDNVVSQDPSQTMSVNTDGETVGKGFELAARQRLEERIDWFANITYTKSRIASPDDPDQNGAEVPFVPEVMANAGISFALPFEIELSPWLHFGGRIYDSSSKANRTSYDSEELLNMSISKTFNIRDRMQLGAFVRLYNITNNRFEMPWQFRDPGFSIDAGAQVAF